MTRLATAYGLGSGLVFPLAAGGPRRCCSRRSRDRDVFALVTDQPTVLFATPSIYSQLLTDVTPVPRRRSPPALRACVSGAEWLPAACSRRASPSALGVEVLPGFGLTQAFHFVIASAAGKVRPGSAGVFRRCPGVGRARRRRRRYDPAAPLTTSAPSSYAPPRRAFGLLEPAYEDTHADLSRRLGALPTIASWSTVSSPLRAGRRAVQGRRQVGLSEEVENALTAHEGVWECAVIGADDEEGLIKPLAFVVTNVGWEGGAELEAELKDYVKQTLAPYKYPRWIEFVDALPRAPVESCCATSFARCGGGVPRRPGRCRSSRRSSVRV